MSANPASRRNLYRLLTVMAAAVAIGVVAWAQLGARRAPTVAGFKVIAAYPHDPAAFTQGLAIEAGQLYEGTGQYGASTVRRVDLKSGRPEKQRALSPRYFGEGIAILGGLLGSMVGVLYGWLILADAAWLDGPLAVLLGTILGGGVMALDGWLAGTRAAKEPN